MSHSDPGSLRRTGAAAVDADPFWSAVRRRHPDVDLVLLSPSADDPPPATGPGTARAETAAVAAAWDLLAPDVADAAGAVAPAARWRRHGAGHRFELQAALTGLGQRRGTALLRASVVVLGSAGWLLSPRTRRGLPALTATDAHVVLRAEAGPGATVLTLRGVPVRVDEGDRDRAVRDLRTERSWE